jgi:hypothetical protein
VVFTQPSLQTTLNRKKDKSCNIQQFFCHNKLVKLHFYRFTWIFFIKSRLRCSLVGELCWSHTQASKPLVIFKNTLELPKFTIVMQRNDNKKRFWWLYFGCFYLKSASLVLYSSSLVLLVLYQGPEDTALRADMKSGDSNIHFCERGTRKTVHMGLRDLHYGPCTTCTTHY